MGGRRGDRLLAEVARLIGASDVDLQPIRQVGSRRVAWVCVTSHGNFSHSFVEFLAARVWCIRDP
jgi:hypothetical protein